MTRSEEIRTATRLAVDRTACDGVGMCAHLAAGLIHLDRWGFPTVPREPVPDRSRRRAEAAVRACPRRALRLDPEEPAP